MFHSDTLAKLAREKLFLNVTSLSCTSRTLLYNFIVNLVRIKWILTNMYKTGLIVCYFTNTSFTVSTVLQLSDSYFCSPITTKARVIILRVSLLCS